VLSGRIVPSGKLPVQIPRHVGGQPGTYLQPALGSVESAGISGLETRPLYPFGYGASYTDFTVGDLRLSAPVIASDGEFTATVRVANTGDRVGDEVVQLYLRDVVAKVARPLKLLTGFARVALEPGEAADVTFRVHADRTAYTGPDLRRIVEPGEFEVMIGTSSLDLPCRAMLRVGGNVRVVGHDRVLTTPVTVNETISRTGGGG
jgi:beta-glucosidase